MKGAILGDIVGSVYERHNTKSKAFPLFSPVGRFTDDTVLTCAVAKALMSDDADVDLLEELTYRLQQFGLLYPHAGYGGAFKRWFRSDYPQPYNSWGNGAPMRCSPAGFVAGSAEKAYALGEATAEPTHNHPEGLKAAGLTAELVWRARHGESRETLRERALELYELPALDEARPTYEFTESSQGTMPVALAAFFESTDFEDAIRNAISVGGDSDTIGAITGAIAEAYYGVPDELWRKATLYLDDYLLKIVTEFYAFAEARS